MAKLKATPKNYAEAQAVLASRGSVRLGNNTYLERHFCGIAVRLHNSNIVMFHEDGRVVLFSGGYRTVTTKERINHFITGRVFQSKSVWYYRPRIIVGEDGNIVAATVPNQVFEEGMAV